MATLARGTLIDVYSTHCHGSHVGEVAELFKDAVGSTPARVHVMLRVERRDAESCGLDDSLNQSQHGHLIRDVPVLVSPSQDQIEAALAWSPFVGVEKVAVKPSPRASVASKGKADSSVTSGDGGMRNG